MAKLDPTPRSQTRAPGTRRPAMDLPSQINRQPRNRSRHRLDPRGSFVLRRWHRRWGRVGSAHRGLERGIGVRRRVPWRSASGAAFNRDLGRASTDFQHGPHSDHQRTRSSVGALRRALLCRRVPSLTEDPLLRIRLRQIQKNAGSTSTPIQRLGDQTRRHGDSPAAL
jgi:hypothetical protein